MKCSKCGKEIQEGWEFCEDCGAPVEKAEGVDESSKEQQLDRPNERKTVQVEKKKLIAIGGMALVLIIGIAAFFALSGRAPSDKQVEADFIQNVLYDRPVSLSEFSIEDQVIGETSALITVAVVYEDEDIAYHEKYKLSYMKEDEWVYMEYWADSEPSWSKSPLRAPSAEEVLSKSQGKVENVAKITYDEFVAADTQEDADLETGTATYHYEVKRDTPFYHASGGVQCQYVFDPETGEWVFEDSTYLDDYEFTYDLTRTWSGTAEHNYKDEYSAQMNVVSLDDQNITVKLLINGEAHELSSENHLKSGTSVKLIDKADSSYCLTGDFNSETWEFIGKVYADYSPNSMWSLDFYNIKMSLQ